MSILKSNENNEIIVLCDCGCGEGMHIKIEREEDFYTYISYLNGHFYSEQEKSIVKKIKKIWAIIRNKDFHYAEIVLTKDDFEEFKNFINKQK